MSNEEHTETHIAQICVRHPSDYPNSPIDINRPRALQNWWDITIEVQVIDGEVRKAEVKDIRKSP